MTTKIDLQDIKIKARMAMHQDGLDEILIGLSLGIMAIFFLDFRLSIALIVGCMIQIFLKPACRRQITYTRIGYAKLKDPKEKIKSQKMLIVAIVLVLIGAGLFFVSKLRWLLPPYLGIFLAGVTLAQVWKAAHTYDYFIISLFLASGLAGLLLISLDYEPRIATAIQGWSLAGLLIPIGLIRLNLFLRKYPKTAKEAEFGKE